MYPAAGVSLQAPLAAVNPARSPCAGPGAARFGRAAGAGDPAASADGSPVPAALQVQLGISPPGSAARARIAAATQAAEAGLAHVHGRPYAVFHDAYAHFEARFDMPALGALALSDGAKPGARHLAALRDKLVEAGARCVFSEPQFPPRLVSAITEGTGIRHADLDPLGAELAPGPALYPALIEAMADAMAGCLKD